MSNDKEHISICICTFKRPHLLWNLLNRLKHLITRDLFTYSIIVVDNDMLQSAKHIVNKFKSETEIDISYSVEKEQNIALARNKAIMQATGDFIAFIDDDEMPEQSWLLNLFLTIKKYETDGVLGPVLSYFEEQPPKWVKRGRFFERPRYKTGHILNWKETRTGNVLIKKTVFLKNNNWFRKEYGSGGEDRDFFSRKINEGFTFIWCDEAKVYEIIPKSRCNLLIQIERAIIRGRVALIRDRNNLKNLITSGFALGIYSLSLPLLLFLSPLIGFEFFARYLISFFDHLSKIIHFLGLKIIRQRYIITS